MHSFLLLLQLLWIEGNGGKGRGGMDFPPFGYQMRRGGNGGYIPSYLGETNSFNNGKI